MSISDKITRLNNAKTSIASAITNKGGEVAQGDGFEDFASAIASIPSGSGVEILEGTYTPTSDVITLTITHNKGKKIVYGTIECDIVEENAIINMAEASTAIPFNTEGFYYNPIRYWLSSANSNRVSISSGTSWASYISDNLVRFPSINNSYKYKGGVEYRYKLYFVDEEGE